MDNFSLSNNIVGGLMPYLNLVYGITDGISPEEARQSALHLKAALGQLPEGPQLIKNMGLERLGDKEEIRIRRVSRIITRIKERREENREPNYSFADRVVQNLIKCQRQIGYELAEAWQHSPDEVADEELEYENPLTRNQLTDKEFEEGIDQLFETFPNIEWDEELIADALFASIHGTGEYLKRFVRKWK